MDARCPGARVDALRPQPGQPLLLMFGQQLPDAEAGQHAFITPQPRIAGRKPARVRRHIGITEQRGVITHRACGKRDVTMAGVERRAVAADPVVHLIEAGVEAGARRRAGRRSSVVAPEQHALGHERIHIRRFHHRMSRRRQTIAAPLVAGDEKNIRAAHSVLQTLLLKTVRPLMEPKYPDRRKEAVSSIGEHRSYGRSLL